MLGGRDPSPGFAFVPEYEQLGRELKPTGDMHPLLAKDVAAEE